MGKTERLYRLKKMLDAGRCPTKQALLSEFEISLATLKRDLSYLRDRMGVPLVFDRERGGWRLDLPSDPSYRAEFFLRDDEIHAFLAMQQLLAHVEPSGVLGPYVAPMQRRLIQLLEKGLRVPAEAVQRIRVLSLGARRLDLPCFQVVAHAVLLRSRLRICYRARGSGDTTEREVSPQRLAHYRENWYLDAWCHLRDQLRSFSVDAIVERRCWT